MTRGIDAEEPAALSDAGLDGEAILRAGTRAPADVFGFDRLGALRPGRDATFLLLERDPLIDPLTLASPRAVVARGARQR